MSHFQYNVYKKKQSYVVMVKRNSRKETKKRRQKEMIVVFALLRDIDMKLNHIIERLKMIYNYLNTLNSSLNSK